MKWPFHRDELCTPYNPRALFALTALLCGCSVAPTRPATSEVAPMAEIALERGRFELNCDDIQLETIGLMNGILGWRSQVFGLRGCGQHVIYHVECQIRCVALRDTHLPGLNQEEGW